jgi:hypothetical protein
MESLTRNGVLALVIAACLMTGAGYLYGASSVAPRTTTVLSTTTSTLSTTLTEMSTATSTATWTETAYFPTPETGQLGVWNETTSYPFAPGNLSCVVNDGFVYCVGGYNDTSPLNITESNDTFYASLSPTGVGQWIRTTDYPMAIGDESCISSSDYIYCVGGFSGSGTGGALTGQTVADVYYASISPSGIESWKQTTAYPYPVEFPQCMTDSSYIYCVTNRFNGTTNIPGSYFASLSPAGVGNWKASSQPPLSPNGCSASGGYAYCDGGESCAPQPPPFSCPSPFYFAPLSQDGLGAWTRTTDLPTAVQGFFVTASSYGYFFGGPIYYIAHLSSNGTGSWTTSTPYPENSPMTCVANGDYFYCIGTSTVDFYPSNNVYFAEIG